MKKIYHLLLIILGCFLGHGAEAQLISVGPDAALNIAVGTSFNVGNLTLIPSAKFTLSGTSLTQNSGVTNTSDNSTITNADKFSTTTNPYSGAIKYKYATDDLNSIAASNLNLFLYNGSAWQYFSGSIIDSTGNMVSYTPASAVALNEITLGKIAPPTITSFTPTLGSTGTTVTITGTRFTNVSAVRFGGTTAKSFIVVSATSIMAVVASGTTGKVSVTTLAVTGTSNGTFTFQNTLTWTGATNTDWNTATNWSPNMVPLSTDIVTVENTSNIPVVTDLTIATGGTVTIVPGAALTVTGTLTNNSEGGLVIQSDGSGTGSLIVNNYIGGIGSYATVQRWILAGKWNIVSSPLSGESVVNFLSNNIGIATKNVGGFDVRGILDYLPQTNAWSDPTVTGPSGNLGGGKGFSMRLQGTTPVTDDAVVTFTGSLQVGSQLTATVATYWNCIGNPYTSAIGITTGSASTANFLTENVSNLDPSYGAIYIWNAPDASNGLTGQYTAISNTSPPYTDIQQGQAFLVNANTEVSSFSFTSNMQIHNTGLALKSTKSTWPTIKLEATFGQQKSSTTIAFNYGMTNGLDVTYDAGLLKGATDLIIYTRLVEDNGIPFAIQALPINEYSNLIIPVGLDFKTGGQVVFSAELTNLSSDCLVILEDKLIKKFTDLSQNTYTVTIAANSSISDRFQIHTSNLTTGLNIGNGEGIADKLSVWAIRNTEIRISGKVSKQAIATLYDIQGRVILIKNLEEGSRNVMGTPNLRNGIYLLLVKDNNRIQGFKIPVSE